MGYFSVWAIFLPSFLPHSWPCRLSNAPCLTLSENVQSCTVDYTQRHTHIRWGVWKAVELQYLIIVGPAQSAAKPFLHISAQSVNQPSQVPLHALLCRNSASASHSLIFCFPLPAGESVSVIKHTDPVPDPRAVNQDKKNMLFSVSHSLDHLRWFGVILHFFFFFWGGAWFPLSIFSITQSTPIKATVCFYLHFKYLFLKFVYRSYLICPSKTSSVRL